jgi:hypothetical protein
MMPICDSYLAQMTNQYKVVAMQGMGIVFLGNFSGMVGGLVLSPPPSKTIGGTLFGGLVGIAIALTLILKKTKELIDNESN